MELKSCNIIEHDTNNKITWAWSFPTVTAGQRDFALRKFSDLRPDQGFAYAKYWQDWCYIFSAQVDSETLHKVKQCALIVWASEYNIAKYEELGQILCRAYCKTGDPTAVLQLHLSVTITGTCNTEENCTFLTKNFESTASRSDNPQLIEIINTFGLKTILIYTALLLKKRLFVYDHNLSSVLLTVESLARLLPHRDMSDSIYPWVHLVPDEIDNLKGHGGYLAGSVDSNIATNSEMFDILVNVAAREVEVSPSSRDAFIMTKTHKDIALFLVQLAETNHPDISGQISRKTDDLLAQLKLLATIETSDGKQMVSIETLRQRQFPAALENFLFNLAVAENVMLL